MSLYGSKKGQLHNYITVVVILFGFGVLSVIMAYVMNQMITLFAASGHYGATAAVVGSQFLAASYLFDKIIVFLMAALLVGVGITSYRLASPPIFFLLTLVMAGLLGLVSYFFSYMFVQIVGQPVFTATMAYFGLTMIVCTNLHWVALGAVIIGSITLYAKRRQEAQIVE